MPDRERYSPEHLAALDSIIEQSGLDISREQAEQALVRDAYMHPERLMQYFPELAEGKTAVLEGYTAVAMDFPGYTEINNDPNLAPELAFLIDSLHNYAAEYIESLDQEIFVLGSAGDELTMAANVPLEEIIALALELQLSFENIVATSPKLSQYYDQKQVPKLHFGIARPQDTEIAVKYIETGVGHNKNYQLITLGMDEAKALSKEFITAGSLEALESEQTDPSTFLALEDTRFLQAEVNIETVFDNLAARGVDLRTREDNSLLASGSKVRFLNVSQSTNRDEMEQILAELSLEKGEKTTEKTRQPILDDSIANIMRDGRLHELSAEQQEYVAKVLRIASTVNRHRLKPELLDYNNDVDAVVAFTSTQGLKHLAVELANELNPGNKVMASEIFAEVLDFYGTTMSRLRNMGFIKEFEVHDNGALTSVLTYNIYNNQNFLENELLALTRLSFLTRSDANVVFANGETVFDSLSKKLQAKFPFFQSLIGDFINNYQGNICTNISIADTDEENYIFSPRQPLDEGGDPVDHAQEARVYNGSAFLAGNLSNKVARMLFKLRLPFFESYLDSLNNFIGLYQPEDQMYELLAQEYGIFSSIKERIAKGTMIMDQALLDRFRLHPAGHKVDDLNLHFRRATISLAGFDTGQRVAIVDSGQIRTSNETTTQPF